MAQWAHVPTGADVLAYGGLPADDVELAALAATHVEYWRALAVHHTRGHGFAPDASESFCDAAIRQVLISAALRSMMNPANARRIEAGTWNTAPANEGLSLAERLTLDRLRVRTG